MDKWKIANVDISLLRMSELNANVMSDSDYQRLVENIRISGGLSSAIGCYKKGEEYIIFSGHHRYKACVELRYTEVPVIYADEEDLTKDEILALQTSHNSLHGTDDKGILKRLFEQIESIQFKEFSHVNINEIKLVDIDNVSFSIEKETFSVSFVFYKRQLDLLMDMIGVIREQKAKNDIVVLTDSENTEELYLHLMKEVGKEFSIKSTNIKFQKILELAKQALDNENSGNQGNEG